MQNQNGLIFQIDLSNVLKNFYFMLAIVLERWRKDEWYCLTHTKQEKRTIENALFFHEIESNLMSSKKWIEWIKILFFKYFCFYRMFYQLSTLIYRRTSVYIFQYNSILFYCDKFPPTMDFFKKTIINFYLV